MAQLIISWARKPGPQRDLELHAKGVDDPALANFACSVTGLTALNFATQIHTVQERHALERGQAMRLTVPFLDAMDAQSLDPIRIFDKTTVALLCVDNSRDYRRPIRLYQSPDRVRDRSDLSHLLRTCLRAIVPEVRQNRINEGLLEAAGRLVFEAFSNTHEHAQSDFRGDRLRRSVRGLLIGYRYFPQEDLGASAGSHLVLKRHFEAWRPDQPGARNAQYLDISVFDSGSGLAQTWLGRKGRLTDGILIDGVSLEEEFEAVLDCLRKGGTTKSGNASGNGLYRIMEVVRHAGGFIRIRSGRLSVGRAFGVLEPPLDPANIQVEDLIGGGRPRVVRPWAEGTTVSVLLPLNRAVQ
jgi:hypothetical protein